MEQKVVESVGLSYEKVGGGYEVTGIGDCTDEHMVIPALYNNHPVTSIGDSAFQGASISDVIIPDSIIKIVDYAFYD